MQINPFPRRGLREKFRFRNANCGFESEGSEGSDGSDDSCVDLGFGIWCLGFGAWDLVLLLKFLIEY